MAFRSPKDMSRMASGSAPLKASMWLCALDHNLQLKATW
jgi:hypothetical protein